jgi:hypothetical protein
MKMLTITLGAGLLLAGNLNAQSQLLGLTPVQANVATLARNMEGNSFYLAQFVAQVNRTWAWTWGLPTEDLEALLNDRGAARVQAMIAAQGLLAAQLNPVLEATGAGPRVDATPGREFTIDEATGYITVVPLPEEAPEEPAEN